MPRAFTEEESTRIRASLLAAGREAFGRRGLRGTSVDELARAAAISKGAFYRFFDSKEDLLFALLDQHETTAHAEMEAAVRAEPSRAVDLLVDGAAHAASDPLAVVLMSEEGLRAVHARSAGDQQRMLDRDVRLVDRVLGALHDGGLHLDLPRPVLLGLMRSLVFVGLHRADIGSDLVDEVTGWVKRTMHAALHPTDQAPQPPTITHPTATPPTTTQPTTTQPAPPTTHPTSSTIADRSQP